VEQLRVEFGFYGGTYGGIMGLEKASKKLIKI
jgi:hypothetical protein